MSEAPGGQPPVPEEPSSEGTKSSEGGAVSTDAPPEEASLSPGHLDPPGAPAVVGETAAPTLETSDPAGPIQTEARLPPQPPGTPQDLGSQSQRKEEEVAPRSRAAVEEFVEEPEEGSPAWMMTFGDMMSLLLTFFILMFSMSTIEVEKFKAAAGSLKEALGEANSGVLPGANAAVDLPRPPGEVRSEIVDEEMETLAEQLEQFVRENHLEDHVVVTNTGEGVYLRMQNQALFGPGSADIAAASIAIVEQLGSMLDQMDLPVKVSGHTDNVPIRSAVFPSNWELSAARAAGVARILVSRGHDPAVISVEAYGEYRAVATNDTAEGRSQNRRVELFFARTAVEGVLDNRGELPALDGEAADVEPERAESPEPVSGAGDEPEGGS